MRTPTRRRPAAPHLSPLAQAVSLSLSTSLLLAPCAQAQTTAPASDPSEASTAREVTLGTVTVRAGPSAAPTEGSPDFGARSANTATRLDLTPRETPQSLSVVTHAQMQAFGLRDARSLLSSVTGVNVEQVETDRAYYSVRGFEVSNFQIDGIGLPFATGDQQGDIDTAIYDRVEVLRGANGLLSSTGNPSATINFVRKRPTAALQASGGLTLGSWNQRRVDADLSGALNASASVRGRLIVAAENKDAYLDRYSLDKRVFSGIVEADLTPSTLLSVGHSQQNNRPKGVLWGALPMRYADGTQTDYPVSASTSAAWSYWNTRDTQTFAELSHQLDSGWTVKGVLTRRELSSDAKMLYVYGAPDRETGTGLFSWPSKYSHTERQWIGDLHASGPFELGGRRHEAVLGLNSSRSDSALRSSDDDLYLPISEADVLAGNFPRPDFDSGLSGYADLADRRHSLYGAARLSLHDSLRLITGLNVTRATSTGVQYGLDHNYAATKSKPFVGAIYELHPRFSAYASAAGIFNPQHQLDVNNAVLAPIEGRNTEIGIKGESADHRLNGSFALFRTTQKNTAEYAGFANGHSYYRGIDATSTGFEFDVAGQVLPGWQVSAGYTRLRIRGSEGQDVRTYVPRQTLRLSSVVQVAAVPGLELGASLKWQSAFSRDEGASGVTRQDAYALVDLMARYALSRQLSLSANVHNLTDEKYLGSLQWSQSYYAAPRGVSVSLNWKL